MRKRLLNILAIVYCAIFSSPVIAGEENLYDFEWLDPGKKVFVLQNKYFSKAKSLYIDAGHASNNTSEFQTSNGANLKIGYFFNEDYAFEVSHTMYNNKKNNAYDSVKAVNGIIPFSRKIISTTALYAIWSPFYGKVNTFNKIYYFDWYLGAGIGIGKLESNFQSVTNPDIPDSFEAENYTTLNLKTGIRAHITKRLHINLEYVNQNYKAKTPAKLGKEVFKQSNDLIISFGVSF